ncbi:acid protease [Exidia glandulosa HHB12029]|uniref:Acid protease n=1 Tax=Exidia glandulosa HHB12029 TaxID=1314781 RepID=A0A165I4Z2_EXIGL|nr:acid protease [Exidia glandulosa HHB12029]
MLSWVVAVAVLSSLPATYGVQLALTRHPTPNSATVGRQNDIQRRSGAFSISGVANSLYSAEFSIGQRPFSFVLDTGSSDLWLYRGSNAGEDSSLGLQDGFFNLGIQYGSGSISGEIAFAPFHVGNYTVASQALLDVSVTTGFDALYNGGASGIIGLGFGGPSASVIEGTIFNNQGGSLDGQTVLANIFASDPSGDTFLAFQLNRDDRNSSTPDGTFSINEVPDTFVEAVKTAPITPAVRHEDFGDLPRWLVSVDALVVAGKTVPTRSGYTSAPRGSALGLLDTGTSIALLQPDLVAEIYDSIPGSKLVHNPSLGSIPDIYLVPCTARMSVSFVVGQQNIFIDPRDVVMTLSFPFKGSNKTVCIGAFFSTDSFLLPSFDLQLGDSFLRNAFIVYNYNGNLNFDTSATKMPFVQLVPVTKEITNDTEYLAARQAALANLPPEANLTDPDLIPALLSAAAPLLGIPGDGGSTSAGSGPTAGSPTVSGSAVSRVRCGDAVCVYVGIILGSVLGLVAL